MAGRIVPLLSLFCGAGGLDEGLRQVRHVAFRTMLAVDIKTSAVATFRANHPGATVLQLDLSQVSESDLISHWESVLPHSGPAGIIGGPPCQSFSVANVHKKDNDPRDDLPQDYCRILGAFHQRYGLDFFLFENVPGLLSQRHRARFESFINQCTELGFTVTYDTLDAVAFGVPQYRKRVFVVGINSQRYPGLSFRFPRPRLARVRTVRDVLQGLPEPAYFSRRLRPKDIPYHENHWCMNPRSRKFQDGRLAPGTVMGRSFRVLSWDKPSWTVTYGHREMHIHPEGHRRLSIYEAMRLQGFDRKYRIKGTFSEQVSLVCDAVPPPVARSIGEELVRQLGLAAATGGRHAGARY